MILAALPLLLLAAAQEHHHEQKGGAMHQRFENPEQWAKSFDDPKRDAWQMPDRVIASLGLKSGQSVADIGAGTGYFSMKLAKAPVAPQVFAADLEPSMVDYLRKRAEKEGLKNVTGVVAGTASPNLPRKVDVILMVNTYHHIEHRVDYFRKLAESLAPGGRIAIIDYRPESTRGPAGHKIAAAKIEEELGKAGFRKAAQHDYLPEQNYLIFSVSQ